MSEDPEAPHERTAIQHMIRHLGAFARGLGLDEAATRQIVEQVVADMQERSEEDRLETARRCLLATASV